MNLPNLTLMRAYGTAPVFFEKTAGGLSLGARIGAGILGAGMLRRQGQEISGKVEESARQNQLAKELELMKMEAAIGGLRHTQAPIFAPDYMPPGMDEGMVRLAHLAKEAGIDVEGLEKGAAGVFGGILGGVANALKPAAPAAGALQQGASQAFNRAGLGGGQWKWKLPALAGAYAGYKGLTGGVKGALGYMSAEPGEAVYGGGRPGLAYGVNRYGQPQRGTPFMT